MAFDFFKSLFARREAEPPPPPLEDAEGRPLYTPPDTIMGTEWNPPPPAPIAEPEWDE